MAKITIPIKYNVIILLGLVLVVIAFIFPRPWKQEPNDTSTEPVGVVAGEFTDSGPGFPRVAMQSQRGDEIETYLDRAATGDVFMVAGNMPLGDLQYIKSRNQDIKVIAFIGSFCGIPLDISEDSDFGTDYSLCDTSSQFHERNFYNCELFKWLDENDGWLYRADSEHYVGFVKRTGAKLYMFCLAEGCPAIDSQGRNLADFYSDLVNSMIFENSFGYQQVDLWDGAMIDCAEDMSWTTNLYNEGVGPDFDGDHIADYFVPAWRNEEVRFFEGVRQYAGMDHAFLANGVHWGHQYLNGFQIEYLLTRADWNCDSNQECLWQTNMFYMFPSGTGLGYLAVQDLYYDQPFRVGMPHIGWCCGTEETPAACCDNQQCEDGEAPLSSDLIEFNRYKRFAIGTVALGDGFLSFNWNNECGHAHTEAWPPAGKL